jgi:hypothetical protein
MNQQYGLVGRVVIGNPPASEGYHSLTEISKFFPELGPTLEQPTANEDVRMLKRFLVWHLEAVP